MELHKLAHELGEAFRGGHHLHLPLFAGLIGAFKNFSRNPKNEIGDLGDLGDNVPATLLNFLSSRRGL